jgi:phosphatidylserine/phosphatidylglycerophosphate/cardiolipin synthase-like enzyme
MHGKSEVFFAPHDRPRDQLVALINQARTHIYAAVFVITDQKIASALTRAKGRGIPVEIITDAACMQTRGNKIEMLKQGSVDIFLYKRPPHTKVDTGPYMHHKFAIIDNNIWTGSYNWTRSASERNAENALLITEDLALHRRYLNQFEVLKKQCALGYRAPQASKTRRGETPHKSSITQFLQSIRNYFATAHNAQRR